MLHGAILAVPTPHARILRLRHRRGAGRARRRRPSSPAMMSARAAWAPSSRTSMPSPRARCAMSASPSPPSRPRPRRRRAPRCRLIEVDYEELPAVLVAGGGARAGRAASCTRTLADYIKVFDAGIAGQCRLAHPLRGGRRRRRLGGVRRDRRGRVHHPGAGACRHRALRRAGRDRAPAAASPCGRPTSRCSACRPTSANPSGSADVAAALPDAARRRRLRQQDGGPCPADRRGAGAESRRAGAADPRRARRISRSCARAIRSRSA